MQKKRKKEKKQPNKNPRKLNLFTSLEFFSKRSTQQISHLLLNDLSSTSQLLHSHKLIYIMHT